MQASETNIGGKNQRLTKGVAAYETLVSDAHNFLRLGRSIRDALLNGRLTTEQFLLLIVLHLDANPHNGIVKTSYAGLYEDFRRKFSTNYITRVLGALKKKKYLYYPKRQGKSGSFLVYLNNYPLSNKRFTNIEKKFLEESPLKGEELEIAKTKAELIEGWHKFLGDTEAISKGYYGTPESFGRSTNNDNENKNKNKNNKSLQ